MPHRDQAKVRGHTHNTINEGRAMRFQYAMECDHKINAKF